MASASKMIMANKEQLCLIFYSPLFRRREQRCLACTAEDIGSALRCVSLASEDQRSHRSDVWWLQSSGAGPTQRRSRSCPRHQQLGDRSAIWRRLILEQAFRKTRWCFDRDNALSVSRRCKRGDARSRVQAHTLHAKLPVVRPCMHVIYAEAKKPSTAQNSVKM